MGASPFASSITRASLQVMSREGKGAEGQHAMPQEEHSPERDRKQPQGGARHSSARQTAEEERNLEEREDPEEYADPICVCEPEPYWQEVAEQLERELAQRQEPRPARRHPRR